jgi:hypothetical protein
MAAPTGDFYGVGARYARALVLSSYGIPAATAAAGVVYEGFELATLKNFNVETPDSRRIDHYGGDRIRAVDSLPPNSSGKATMALGSINLATLAALTSTKVATIGEASVAGIGTSQRGLEANVCLYAVQQQVNSSGIQRWRMLMAPVARATFKNAPMNDNTAEYGVDLLLAISKAYPWGIAYTVATEGYVDVESLNIFTDNFPVLVAWKGDGTVTKFLFPTDKQAFSTDKIHGVWLWDTGTKVSAVDATVTKATDGVTPTTKPDAGDIIICLYESLTAPA